MMQALCFAVALLLAPRLVLAGEPALPGGCPTVVRAHFKDRAQLAALATWAEPWEVNADAGYVVLAVDQAGRDRLAAAGFAVEVDATLTGRLCRPRAVAKDQPSGIPGFPCYATTAETLQRAQALVQAHPDLATLVDIGDSWEKTHAGEYGEGHDLVVLRLGRFSAEAPLPPGSRPTLFAMGGLHAREYAPPELLLRFAEQLVAGYGGDADATWLLDEHEIHLLLYANPDGRTRAEAGILWRKNADNDYCPDTDDRGVDLNRNFEFGWGCCDGSSDVPCNEVFRGPAAASEPEIQAVEQYIRALFPSRWAPEPPPDTSGLVLDMHSYGQLVLWPWGSTATPAPNHTALQTLGRKLAFFNGCRPEQAMSFYPTDGTSTDFTYGDRGVASYTIEMGSWFFEECGNFEGYLLSVNLNALTYAAKVAGAPYLTPSGPDVTDIVLEPDRAARIGEQVTVTARVDDGRYSYLGGAEPHQTIAGATLTVDRPPWADPTPETIAMTPVDGALDASTEELSAVVDVTGLGPGRHTLPARSRRQRQLGRGERRFPVGGRRRRDAAAADWTSRAVMR